MGESTEVECADLAADNLQHQQVVTTNSAAAAAAGGGGSGRSGTTVTATTNNHCNDVVLDEVSFTNFLLFFYSRYLWQVIRDDVKGISGHSW